MEFRGLLTSIMIAAVITYKSRAGMCQRNDSLAIDKEMAVSKVAITLDF